MSTKDRRHWKLCLFPLVCCALLSFAADSVSQDKPLDTAAGDLKKQPSRTKADHEPRTANEILKILSQDVPDNALEDMDRWIVQVFDADPKLKNVETFINDYASKANDMTLPCLYKAIERRFNAASSNDVRKLMVTRYVEIALGRSDTKRAGHFLALTAPFLAENMPWEKALWDLRLAIQELDQDAAKQALADAVKTRPAFKSSKEYSNYEYQILKLRSSATRPFFLDLSLDDFQNACQRMEKEGETEKLNQYIRDMLPQKGMHLVESEDDNNLFVGSKNKHRPALDRYKDSYHKYLKDFLGYLSSHPDPAQRAYARRAAITAGISQPSSGESPSRKILSARKTAKEHVENFAPLLVMAPGVLEWVGDQWRCNFGAAAGLDPQSVAPADDALFIQNSRTVACVADNKLIWSFSLPNHQFWPQVNPPACFGGANPPAVVGNVVCARIALPNVGLAVCGFERSTGKYLWRWQEPKYNPMSPPAAWGDDRVVFLAGAPGITADSFRTELFIVDAATGNTWARIPLCSGPTDLDVARQGQITKVSLSGDTHAPLVLGNTAYITTAGGAIVVVDLADENIKWMRVYNRKLESLPISRRVSMPPVIGDKNALFAPLDSNWLLLVEKETGRLVAKKTDLPWTRVMPCGAKTAAVLTQNTVYFLSMNNLSEIRKINGRNMRLVAGLTDGAVIQDEGNATVYDESGSGKTAFRVKPGVWLQAQVSGNWYGFDENSAFGQLTAEPAAADAGPVLLTNSRFSECRIPGASPLCSSNTLVRSFNVICRIGPDGRRLWDIPAGTSEPVLSMDGKVLIGHAGRLWFFDEQSGVLTGRWPDRSDPTAGKVMRAFASGSDRFAVVADPSGQPTLYSIQSPSSVTPFAVLPKNILDTRETVVANGDTNAYLLVDFPNNTTSLFSFDKTNQAPAQALPEFKLSPRKGMGWPSCVQVSGDRRTFLGFHRGNKTVWTFDSSGIREGKNPCATPVHMYASFGFLDGRWFFYNSLGSVALYDIATGKGVDLDRTYRLWTLKGENLLVLRCEHVGHGSHKLIPCTADFAKDLTPTNPGPALPDIYVSGEAENVGRFAIDGNPLLIFRKNSWYYDTCSALWTNIHEAPVIAPFPDLPIWTYAQTLPGNVLLFNETVCLPSDLPLLTDMFFSTHVVHASKQASAIVDGFLDEWTQAEFVETPGGRVAVRKGTADVVWIGAEITDADLVRRMTAAGVDRLLQLHVMSGPLADFCDDSARAERAPVVLSMDNPPPNVECAYAFPPDGKTLSIEVKCGYSKNRDKKVFQPAELGYFGDIALRFRWRPSPAVPWENLLERRASGPLSFTRIGLNHEKGAK